MIGFTASWKITLVVLATFPISIASSAVQMKTRSGQTFDFKSNSDEEIEDYNGALSSSFTHMRTVAAFSMQQKVCNIYMIATDKESKQRCEASYYGGAALGLSNATMFLTNS